DRLVFISDRDGSPQIYLRWMDTGQTAKLTNLVFPPEGLAFSPDGKMISFFSLVPAEAPTIVKMPKAPEGATWAEPAKVIDRLLYRYDRRGYLKPGYTHLFVMPAEPGTPRQLSSGDFNHGTYGFQRAHAVWTPDSKHLLVSANRHGDFEHDPLNTEVYEFAVADGAVRALTDRQGPDSSPAVSPDGKLIAYTGFDDKYQGYQVTRLYVMNRDGTEPRVLTGGLDRDARSPRWAPDGSGIYFLFTDRGVSKLGFCNLDATMQTLAENLGGRASAYGGAAYSVGRDGKFAMNYTTPAIPGDIAVGSRDNGDVNVITAVNRDLLGHKGLGAVEEVRYPSAIDGREIQGWIIKPPDFEPSRKYPLILEIHGGPFANYGPRFD
ncbi:MAG: PD40 domain-containing protein, partial [Phycisphaerales bacterium]